MIRLRSIAIGALLVLLSLALPDLVSAIDQTFQVPIARPSGCAAVPHVGCEVREPGGAVLDMQLAAGIKPNRRWFAALCWGDDGTISGRFYNARGYGQCAIEGTWTPGCADCSFALWPIEPGCPSGRPAFAGGGQ